MRSNCFRPVSYFSPSEFPPACTVGMREGWQGMATIADGFLEGKHSLFTEMADAVICTQLFSLYKCQTSKKDACDLLICSHSFVSTLRIPGHCRKRSHLGFQRELGRDRDKGFYAGR